MKLKIAFLITIVLLPVTGCEKILDFYVGMPFQPKNINSVYVPGLNIFGILKTGSSYDTLNHFFEVQRLLNASDTTDLTEINDAKITLEQITDRGIRRTFHLENYDEGKYTSSELNTSSGEQWNYICTYDTFTVTSSTRIPDKPVLQTESLTVTEKNISFSIQPDTTAFLYEIFYLNKSDYVSERVIPDKNKLTNISLSIHFRDPEGNNNLFIFAYDKNYEKYITTSNIFYKPNAFRPRFTTVEGGYGCFCSAASIKIEI
jgi:hypothetical protein